MTIERGLVKAHPLYIYTHIYMCVCVCSVQRISRTTIWNLRLSRQWVLWLRSSEIWRRVVWLGKWRFGEAYCLHLHGVTYLSNYRRHIAEHRDLPIQQEPILLTVLQADSSLVSDYEMERMCGEGATLRLTESNDRMIAEWSTGKDLEGSGSGLRYYTDIRLEGLKKARKRLSRDSRYPDRNSKPNPQNESLQHFH
jgi:hypothetical protein